MSKKVDEQNDHELLELAAKAAAVPAYWSTDGTVQARPIFVVWGGAMGTMPYEEEWNPLKNDADALRLAVKLGLSVDVMLREGERNRTISANNDVTICGSVLHDGDPYDATRRAIVCAAALVAIRMDESAALEIRLPLNTFEDDWDASGMEAYDDL